MSWTFRRGVLSLHEMLTGRHIAAQLIELNRTQWLSHDELIQFQRNRLFDLLKYANQYVPYYRRVFREVGFEPEDLQQDFESFHKLPVLTKAIIRSNWEDLIAAEPARRKQMSKLSTSGSTGEPLIFMQDSDFRDSVTADIQRHMGWGGWKLGDLQAIIWGVNPSMGTKKKLRAWLIDWVWNRVQLNAFSITDDSLESFTKKILIKKPKIIFGYASGINKFAQYVRNRKNTKITFEAIFSSAEKLVAPVRAFVEETFGCKLFDRYGTFELGGVACECEAHNGLHISVENNYVEILFDGLPMANGVSGDVVVTNLINHGMPFIRYSTGDVGSLGNGEQCPCGRAAPKLVTLDGRKKDAFYARDGRTIYTGFSGYSFNCLAHPSIKQFQVVQKSLDLFVIRLAINGEVPQTVFEDIKKAFHSVFGTNTQIMFELKNEISPLTSGKHQYAISELNKIQ